MQIVCPYQDETHLVNKRTLRPRTQRRTPLVRNEGNHAKHSGGDGQDETGVLAADVVEELRGEQGRNGTEGVTQETLARDGGGGGRAVAVGGVGVRRLEDEVDSEGNRGQGNGGCDPVHVAVLREGVDEEADGQPDGAVHGAVQAVFGRDVARLVGDDAVVLLHLPLVGDPAKGAADGERDVGQAADALVPPALLLEGDGDNGQEHEGHEPGEADPQAEGEDDGLGDEHLDGLDAGVLQEDLDAGRGDVFGGDVALVAGRLADGFGALVQCDSAAGLGEEDDDGDEEGDVGDSLHALDPAPADGHVDEAGIDGRGDGAENSDPGESGHGLAAVLGLVQVVESAADEDGADATEKTEEDTQTDHGVDALGEGETNEQKGEAEETADVDDLTTDHLAEGSQEEGRDSAGEVECEETPLSGQLADAEVLCHAADTRAVCGRGETDEERHQAQQGGDQSLVGGTPVERVLFVAMSEEQDQVFLAVLGGAFCQSEREVDALNRLERSELVVAILVFLVFLEVFAANDAAVLCLVLGRVWVVVFGVFGNARWPASCSS